MTALILTINAVVFAAAFILGASWQRRSERRHINSPK
jgi:hypothetical protein